MPINWFIESVKWKFLIRRLEIVSIKNSFKGVLSGIAFAIISPARIGELAGRVFVLKPENRGKAVFSTIVGSLSQMLITLIIGFVSGIFFIFFYSGKLTDFNTDQLFYLKLVSVVSLIFGFLFLFNLKHIVQLLKKLKFNIKFLKYIDVLSEYRPAEIFKVLFFCNLRYLVFVLQFLLLLKYFNVEILWYDALIGIALTYLFSSLIPVLSVFEIGVRGMAAIIFLGIFSNNIPGILSAVTVLWFVNLALPACVGAIIFYRTKI